MAVLGKTIQAGDQGLDEWHNLACISVVRHAERQRDALGIRLRGQSTMNSKKKQFVSTGRSPIKGTTIRALRYVRVGLVHGLVRDDKVIEPLGCFVQLFAHKGQDGIGQFARLCQRDQGVVQDLLVGCLGEGAQVIELVAELGSREFGHDGEDTVTVLVGVHGDVQGASILNRCLEEGHQGADQILAGLHLQGQDDGDSKCIISC